MTKKGIILITCVILVGLCLFWYSSVRSDAKDLSGIYNGFLDIESSINDEIRDNSLWCGAFQLARQDLVKNVDINSRPRALNNLKDNNFPEDLVPSGSYYNKAGLYTLDLKSEIEKGVQDNLRENISISNFASENSLLPQSSDYYEGKKEKRYVIFSKFKKSIDLKNMFERMEDGEFAGVYDDVKYFGISCNSDKQYNKVEILYYYTNLDFAVSIKTFGGDDIMLVMGTRGNTFMDIYKRAKIKAQLYTESKNFSKYDCLKIPEINLDFGKDFHLLRDQKFTDTEGNIYKIRKATQGIAIKLDNTFGTRKNNKLVDLPNLNVVGERYHYLYFNEPFTMFVGKDGSDLPYFAAQVSDIKLFQ